MLKHLSYKSKNINYSPLKLIKLIKILKHKPVAYIIHVLGKMKNKGAICLKHLILNAYHQNGSPIEDHKQNVYLTNIIINKSIRFKKIRPAPQGRVKKINKQFVNIILILKKEDGTKG
ncbi:large ribosomal subunit protein uL22 [Candidatus Karelsulcia muelleri]